MKRIIIICCLLLYCCISLIGQKDENIHPWTIGTTYLPRLEKFGNIDYLLHYPLSIGLDIEYRINDHFSISLGTSLHYEKNITVPLTFGGRPSSLIYGYYTSTLYGIPIQLKYFYTKDKTKRFLPFFKTALINTYNRLYSETLLASEDLNIYSQDEYYIYWQLGYGVDTKIYKRVSMTAQIAFGLDLRNKSSFKSHIEPLVGLRYDFK
jgi:hypothetical protein